MKISDQSIITRAPAILVAGVGDDMVMMDAEKGRYYALDSIGADIWSRLETPLTVADLIAGLSREYDGEPQVIRQDVFDLLTAMAAQGVLSVQGG